MDEIVLGVQGPGVSNRSLQDLGGEGRSREDSVGAGTLERILGLAQHLRRGTPPGTARSPVHLAKYTVCDRQGEPIDLVHGGAARTIGSYLLDTSDGLVPLRLRARAASPARRQGSRSAASARRPPPPAPLAHPPRPRGRGRLARARASGAAGLGLRDRGAASRRPVQARAQRAAALRRRFRRSLGGLAPVPEANVHVAGNALPGSTSSRRPATRRTTSATSTARRSTPATRPGSGSSRTARCCRRPRRRTSTSRPGTGRRGGPAPRPRPARADPLRARGGLGRHLAELRERLDAWASRSNIGLADRIAHPETIEIAQDRLREKNFLRSIGVATARDRRGGEPRGA